VARDPCAGATVTPASATLERVSTGAETPAQPLTDHTPQAIFDRDDSVDERDGRAGEAGV
jgi:hypothetical protein